MNYSCLRQMDISNGPGIRISLFVSGCQFHCYNCFNKEAQDYNYGKPYAEETTNKILELVSKPHIAGLSILGGDPLWQSEKDMDKLALLSFKIRDQLNKNVWIWSGFTWEQLFCDPDATTENVRYLYARKYLIRNCDVFVDGRYKDDLRDLRLQWRGSSNQRVIDVQKSLVDTNNIILYENGGE